MTKEEFEKRYGTHIDDWVLGYDCFMQRTLVHKINIFHIAVTQKDFDDIAELFKKYAEAN
jgi:hypothetical protein